MPSQDSRASSSTAPVEIEAKIRVASFSPFRRRISSLGGRLQMRRTLETNTLFDDAKGTLRSSGRSFRVRRYPHTGVLTLKGTPRVSGGLKSRVEYETEVDSAETLERILMMLGYLPRFVYEKYREVWSLRRTVICFDDTPLGRFVEIEGREDAIRRVAKALGLRSEDFLSTSYPMLWFESGRSGNMVFERKAGRA